MKGSIATENTRDPAIRPLSGRASSLADRSVLRSPGLSVISRSSYAKSPVVSERTLTRNSCVSVSRSRSVRSSVSKSGAGAPSERSADGRKSPGASTHRKMEPAFVDVDTKEQGLRVWLLQGNSLEKVEEKDQSFFHEAAAYIVLKVYSEDEVSLHCWFGENCSPEDTARTEEKAHELDRLIGNAHTFSVEVQGHESPCFMRVFPDGIIYIEEKPKTAIRRASHYAKRLYSINGRKYVRASCVEPSLDSMESSSALILDGFPRMYVWIGTECGYVKRTKAIRIARRIRNTQRRGKAHIVVIDESDENLNTAFMKKLRNGHRKAERLKPPEIVEPRDSPEGGVCEPHKIVLHRVSGERVLYDMPEAARRPLQQCYLVKRDSYLLDSGPLNPLYVWVGGQASNDEISNAIRRGRTFREHNEYPHTIPIIRISEDHEPMNFKKCFSDWRDKATKNRQLTKSFTVGNIGRALFSRSDRRTVAKFNEVWSEDVLPEDSFSTEVWRLSGETLESIPWDQHGIFCNGDCYVILESAEDTNHKSRKILYYWLGSKTNSDQQEMVVELAFKMDDALNHETVMVRVLDEKEPQHFMTVLQNSIIVYDQDLIGSSSQTQLFCVREFASGSMRVQQVLPLMKSLNSSASFVLTSSTECFLWYGKDSGGPEREYAKHMLGFLHPSRMFSYEIVTEEKEPSAFWDRVGPIVQRTYPEEFVQKKLERRPPRLSWSGCDMNDQRFLDIDDYLQEDLSEEDILIFDTYDQVFVWCGRSVDKEGRTQIPIIAKDYVTSDPAGRDMEEIQLWFVSQNHEPETMTKHFPFWSSKGYSSKTSYECLRKRIRQDNAKIDASYEFTESGHLSKFAIAMHTLSDKRFHEMLKLRKEEFYKLPDWKQVQVLQSSRLRRATTPSPTVPSLALNGMSESL